MRVLGMISGTSHDGVDVAVVDFEADGLVLRVRMVHGDSTPLPDDVRRALLAALPPAVVPMAEVCRLDTLLGRVFAEAAAVGIDAVGGEVDLICSHGQTLFHWVEHGHAQGTLQLGDPSWIVERTGVPVLSHLRAADIAAGGHGAPLVPVLDGLLLGSVDGKRAALNLGGIANMTVLAEDSDPLAYDLGPANALIDAAVVRLTCGAELFDRDGIRAAEGRPDEAMLFDLLDEPYYRLSAPKSTGKELFHDGYLGAVMRRHPHVGGNDLVATVTELTARVVAADVTRLGVTTLVVSGGGADNPTLMTRVKASCGAGVRVITTAELGLPTDTKEAVAFALIGYLSAHGLPGNVPSCTGADRPVVLGSLTPALPLVAGHAEIPERLEISQ